MPYMYEFYNLSFHYGDQLKKHTLASILNALCKAFNEVIRLPRYIIVTPDWDILKLIKYVGFGISGIIGHCLHWLLLEFDRIIECRKDAIRRRRPSAVSPFKPKVIWVKMLDRPLSQPDRIFTVRSKFNSILEDVVKSKRNHYVITFDRLANDDRNFLSNNMLSARGEKLFWLNLDRKIEALDYEKFALVEQPRPNQDEHSSSEFHRQLPEPPQHPNSIHFNRNFQTGVAHVKLTTFNRC